MTAPSGLPDKGLSDQETHKHDAHGKAMTAPRPTHETLSPKGPSDRFALRFARLGARLGRGLAKAPSSRVRGLTNIAATPPMTAAMIQHFASLRRLRDDEGWVRGLLDEAETCRVHMIIWADDHRPGPARRTGIVSAQILTFLVFGALRVCAPRTAYRALAYFHGLRARSITALRDAVARGRVTDAPASALARRHYGLGETAQLSDVLLRMELDAREHRDAGHARVDVLDVRDGHTPNTP